MSYTLRGVKMVRAAALDADGGIPVSPVWKRCNVPQNVGVTPVVSAGQQQELRGGDDLVSMIQEEDNFLGMDLALQIAKLDPDMLVQIFGGTWDSGTSTYNAPLLGTARPRFYLELYVAEFGDGAVQDSDITGYVKFTFWNCIGGPPTFTAQDRNFLSPSFTVKARENSTDSKPSWSWSKVAALPA